MIAARGCAGILTSSTPSRNSRDDHYVRCVLILALVVVAVALTGCSRENVGERLTRECREIVDASMAPASAGNDRLRDGMIRECVWRRGTKETR